MEEKGRILVVDDELNMRKCLFDVLEQEGYKVTLAKDGHEVMGLVRTTPFDLAIVDIKMAWMDGMELIKRIEEVAPEISAIVITAYPSLETAVEAIGNGVSDYIIKPFDMEKMHKAVERALSRKRSLKEKEKLLDDLRQANKRLEETREALIQSGKLATMGQLGAGLFHEVKNLLGIMSVSTHYLKKNANTRDPKVKEHIGIIAEEIVHSNDIIMNLLKLSRQVEHKISPADINKVIEEIVSLMEHELSLQNIKVIRGYGSDLPLVQIDIDQIKQVFLNMILNARDAMPQGGVLRLTTTYDRRQYAQPSYLEVKFSDTGQGIEKSDLEKIFAPFFTTKEKEKSTGLGLTVSNEIVRGHKGRIEVESEIREGTTFSIKLPVNRESVETIKEDLEQWAR